MTLSLAICFRLCKMCIWGDRGTKRTSRFFWPCGRKSGCSGVDRREIGVGGLAYVTLFCLESSCAHTDLSKGSSVPTHSLTHSPLLPRFRCCVGGGSRRFPLDGLLNGLSPMGPHSSLPPFLLLCFVCGGIQRNKRRGGIFYFFLCFIFSSIKCPTHQLRVCNV